MIGVGQLDLTAQRLQVVGGDRPLDGPLGPDIHKNRGLGSSMGAGEHATPGPALRLQDLKHKKTPLPYLVPRRGGAFDPPEKARSFLSALFPFLLFEVRDQHRVPYAYGRPDFRPGNTFFKTSEIRSSGEKPTVFASLSFGIVAGNYLSGKPVDPLISALFRPGVYGYRQKEKAP